MINERWTLTGAGTHDAELGIVEQRTPFVTGGPLLRPGEAVEVVRADVCQRMRAGLERACEETDYCYVCDNHPSHGHSDDCPLNPTAARSATQGAGTQE